MHFHTQRSQFTRISRNPLQMLTKVVACDIGLGAKLWSSTPCGGTTPA
jgi:hypothetical protein